MSGYPEAELALKFIIVGAGVAGLTAAATLSLAGHNVIVLEERTDIKGTFSGGVRIPPNMSKMFNAWGLREQLEKVAMSSKALDINLFEEGECLGRHKWAEELLKDANGEFLLARSNDIRGLLYELAVEFGAEIRLGKKVVKIDPEEVIVALSDGDVIEGDVIVGADGANGLSREMFLEESDVEIRSQDFMQLYSTVVPKKKIMSDPELARKLMNPNIEGLTSAWFGNACSAVGYPLPNDEYALLIWGPPTGQPTGWDKVGRKDMMLDIIRRGCPELHQLAEWARVPNCVDIKMWDALHDWIHPDGPFVIIGEAVHSLVGGSIQQIAVPFEDGATLGRIFSRISSRGQIPVFLEAFEDLRRERVANAAKKEIGDIGFMTLPPGPIREMRDKALREKRDAGIDVLSAMPPAGDNGEIAWDETPEWRAILEQFAYNAEEEGDSWWYGMGIMTKKSTSDAPNPFGAFQMQVTVNENDENKA